METLFKILPFYNCKSHLLIKVTYNLLLESQLKQLKRNVYKRQNNINTGMQNFSSL